MKQYQPPPPAEPMHEPTEEELRLMSSDLSDCEDLWIQELSNYVLDTQKRQKEVERWFTDSCIASTVRSSAFKQLC